MRSVARVYYTNAKCIVFLFPDYLVFFFQFLDVWKALFVAGTTLPLATAATCTSQLYLQQGCGPSTALL